MLCDCNDIDTSNTVIEKNNLFFSIHYCTVQTSGWDLDTHSDAVSMMDETRVPTTDDSNGYDSSEFDEQNFDRPKERWAPLGAAMASPPPSDAETRSGHGLLVSIKIVF